MKTVLIILIIISSVHLFSQTEKPLKVILDTDLDSDIDDAAALAALHHYANEGQVEILATITTDRISLLPNRNREPQPKNGS